MQKWPVVYEKRRSVSNTAKNVLFMFELYWTMNAKSLKTIN